MTIKRINEFPEGSGSLTVDDVFIFMDDPLGNGLTKKIALSEIVGTKIPVLDVGSVSGTYSVNSGFSNSIQKMTFNGSAVTLTKGSGWNNASTESTDVVLKITATSGTTTTWSIVDEWYNQPDAGALASGTHLVLLRGVGTIVEGHYIGSKTN